MSHRPGKFKQTNKGFKGYSKGDSRKKGQVDRKSFKSISAKSTSKARKVQLRKRQQEKKRAKALFDQRLGKRKAPPKIVGFLSLTKSVDTEKIKCQMLNTRGIQSSGQIQQNIFFGGMRQPQRCNFIKIERNKKAVLDAGKIVDILLICVSGVSGIDEEGMTFLKLLRAQGFPTTIVAITDLELISGKKVTNKKKLMKQQVLKHFHPGIKEMEYKNNGSNAHILLQKVFQTTIKPIELRKNRPQILVEGCNFVPHPNQSANSIQNEMDAKMKELGIEPSQGGSNEKMGNLEVKGYLRNRELSANQLVHIVNFGSFQIEQIQILNDPNKSQKPRKPKKNVNDDEMNGNQTGNGPKSVFPNPNRIESLIEERVPQIFNGTNNNVSGGSIEWIKETNTGREDEMMMEIQEKNEDNDSMIGLNDENNDGISLIDDLGDIDDEDMNGKGGMTNFSDMKSVIDKNFNIETFAENLSSDEQKAEEERFEQMVTDMKREKNFPDFVRTPEEGLASVRFKKYKPMKSFRNTEWDIYENLPFEYSKIFILENYKLSRYRALKHLVNKEDENEIKTIVDEDLYIKIIIKNISSKIMSSFNPLKELMIIFGLLKHEHKKSVIHFAIKKTKDFKDPIKNRDEMYVQIGFRTYRCKPLLSENNLRANKFRSERFLHGGDFQIGSIYSHITYDPAPVLVFMHSKTTGKTELAAVGSLHTVNPSRIILKKIVLTGHIFRINKRKAVIRFMFKNPIDVKHYEKCELYTTGGKRGIIRQPLGKHGYMKVLFSDTCQQNELCCLNLYKRVFPKGQSDFVSFLN